MAINLEIGINSSQRRAAGVVLTLIAFVIGWQVKSKFLHKEVAPPVFEDCLPSPSLLELNAATASELEALDGIGPTLSTRILRYREMICGFVELEELRKVYGLKPETYDDISKQLYVKPADRSRCPGKAARQQKETPYQAFEPSTQPAARRDSSFFQSAVRPARKSITMVDLNQADSTQLLAVPGIGEKTAGRIIKFRNRIGYFTQVGQLQEVWGISEENFNRMRDHLSAQPIAEKRLKVNQADKETLGQHPYVGFTNARILIAYRNQHGPFASVDDLREVNGLDWTRLEKALPYLEF